MVGTKTITIYIDEDSMSPEEFDAGDIYDPDTFDPDDEVFVDMSSEN